MHWSISLLIQCVLNTQLMEIYTALARISIRTSLFTFCHTTGSLVNIISWPLNKHTCGREHVTLYTTDKQKKDTFLLVSAVSIVAYGIWVTLGNLPAVYYILGKCDKDIRTVFDR